MRRGRGFAITDADGQRVEDPEVLTRVNELVIPPAWQDVWICPYPGGHIQATGVDQAGRKQYLYHPRWRVRRDAMKFDDMVVFARALPALRKRVEEDLAREDYSFDHVMAIAVRLLDRGFFRIGTEDYAVTNETYGLATMKKRHVRVRGDDLLFDYPAKHSKRRVQAVIDGDVAQDICRLKGRRAGGDELLAYKNPKTRRWTDVKSSDINAWLKDATGEDVSAKDFRTWGATVLAAVGLAVSPVPNTKTARKRAMARVVKEVAHHLGNTPAVARASYIDPRVFDRYLDGTTIAGTLPGLAEEGDGTAIQGEVELAVLELVTGEDSPAMAPPGGADLLIAA
ncbi:DNA topoisomerase IB [Baekduia sp. Peel2402]|uniref:DNA topoisomerase IB n=1 Tax=Baekduia sp. Peel2402 TaxID=3458296 RepID=UPI00403E60AF